jgi:hypothetical protein
MEGNIYMTGKDVLKKLKEYDIYRDLTDNQIKRVIGNKKQQQLMN